MNCYFKLLILISIILNQNFINTFYVFHDKSINENENQEILNGFRIEHNNNNNNNNEDSYPNEFYFHFNSFNKGYKLKFIKNNNNQKSNVYTINNGNKVVNYRFKTQQDCQSYVQDNGNGVLTLIKNNGLKNISYENEFRVLGTIYEIGQSHSLDIIPIIVPSDSNVINSKKKRSIDEKLSNTHDQYHVIYKRESSNITYGDDYIVLNNEKYLNKFENIKKTVKVGANGQPISLYVETLVVTDYTVYVDHQKFANTNNQDLVFLHMRVYFTHLINIVNQRYVNTFANDPDMKIFIALKRFLFLTNLADCAWTDPSLVGDSNFPTYQGREVVVSTKTLDAFIKYMNGLKLSFTFDHAVGLFNKDIFSDSNSLDPRVRSGVIGIAPILGICGQYRYSINEERGGFISANVIAHEIGHNLGAFHDGFSSIRVAAGCPESDNFIMAPTLGSNQNLLNAFKFSSCSIAQFKASLLSSDKSTTSSTGSCLSNALIPSFNTINQTGLIWTADDQCKMTYGPNASFCHNEKSSICTSISCRRSLTDIRCYFISGFGAVDRTTCDSGKSCFQGVCTTDLSAPTGDCLYGDGYASGSDFPSNLVTLPATLMTCSDVIKYFINNNKDYVIYCKDSSFNFASTCCQTCSLYKQITCVDQSFSCDQYKSFCGQPGATLGGKPFDQVCPYTCGTCKRTVYRCSDRLCQNGAFCVDKTSGLAANDLIGFTCTCPIGYSGDFCQFSDPCLKNGNPCKNGGTCQRLGTNGYACLCSSQYQGDNCELSIASLTTTKTSTNTACISNPCGNGGTCFNLRDGGFYCLCQSEYVGPTCQLIVTIPTLITTTSTQTSSTILSGCNSNPCKNNGLCFNLRGGAFFCLCQSGFFGQTCQTFVTEPTKTTTFTTPSTRISACNSNPCKNNGLCFNLRDGAFFCLCQSGFFGQTCQTFVTTSTTTTSSSPRLSACHSNPCSNNGLCFNLRDGTFFCLCRQRYVGPTCQVFQ